jgi:hypothetical protein
MTTKIFSPITDFQKGEIMKSKKIIFPAIAVILCIILVLGIFFFMKSGEKMENIFDEMYLSIKNPTATESRFGFVREIEDVSLVSESDYLHSGVYKSSALENGERITIFVNMKREEFSVCASIEIENTQCIFYTYDYNTETRVLDIKPIILLAYNYLELDVEQYIEDAKRLDAFLREHQVTREYIEKYRDYFLYDKVLTDWVKGNGERSKFTVGNYGDFTVEDNTFANLGEDWGL